MPLRQVHVVPHTHWDREWYLPFQRFRARLVELLDDLLDRLEQDPGYAHFLLDGQMAVLDDYLAVHPEQRPRIEALARSGRLAMGPWYTLPDEFLVSGETLVRNLQAGLARADALGGTMEVGYLPDMFGHVAQMPQLLRQFGFEHAVVWRGVPAAIDRSGFWWSAPDGSTVRAEYLLTGYGNGAQMPNDPQVFLARVDAWIDEVGALLAPHDAVLWMHGSDHRAPHPHLPDIVAAADARGTHDVRITSLTEHLRTAATDDLPHWQGELRSSARANLLMGVVSNRVDVRRAAAHAERAVERLAEPLAALLLPPSSWPTALFDEAWLALLHNAAHDSVCACSDDEVVDAVLHRYAQARQIGEVVAEQALRHLGAQVATRDTLVVNPSAYLRDGIVEVTVQGLTPISGSQVLHIDDGTRVLFDGSVSTASVVVPEIAGWTDDLAGITVADAGPDTVQIVLHADGSTGDAPADRGTLARRLAELARHDPDRRAVAHLRRPPTQRALVAVAAVPGYGWAPVPSTAPAIVPVHVEGTTISNGLVTVGIGHDGTFTLDGISGLARLVDSGDVGDTYNWCPPEHDTVVTGPESVTVEVRERGPLRAVVAVGAQYRWPSAASPDGRRRTGEALVAVRTTVTVHAGEDFVRVEHVVDNVCRDHRLRALFPLARPVASSRAGCAFATVTRGLSAEAGPTETGVPTFPARSFVRAGGLTIATDGVVEYELVDIARDAGSRTAHEVTARALALTVLRATGWLSRGPMATRPLPAGPRTPLRGAQVSGPHTMRYAVSVRPSADPYALHEQAFVPLLTTPGAGSGTIAARGQALRVEGDLVVSSVRRRGGRIELRAFNPHPHPGELRIPGHVGRLVDLRGRDLDTFGGAVEVPPQRIVTVALD